MGKVWCVSSGSYSDYSVDCCFTSEALAVAYAAHMNEVTVEDMAWWHEVASTVPWHGYLVDSAQEKRRKDLSGKLDPYSASFVETFQLWDHLPVKEA